MKKLILLLVVCVLLAGCAGFAKSALPYKEKVDFSWSKEDLEKNVPGGEWTDFEKSGGSMYSIENTNPSVLYDITADRITSGSFAETFDSVDDSIKAFDEYKAQIEKELGNGNAADAEVYVESYEWNTPEYRLSLTRNTPENLISNTPDKYKDTIDPNAYRVIITYYEVK